MPKKLFLASAAFLLATWLGSDAIVARATRPASGIAAAAKDFLDSLDEVRRDKATFALDSDERFDWHFIPRGRRGVAMNELAPWQQKKLLALLRASLSAAGYEKVEQVRELEAILREKEGEDRRFPRDPKLYFASFFGTPGEGTWNWRFEGHHLSTNFALEGDDLVSGTPYFLGANPAIVESGPKRGLRVLGSLEDLARELVTSLDDEQLAVARGEGGAPKEVESMREPRYTPDLPAGVRGAALSESQQRTLSKLIDAYTEGLEDELRAEVREDMETSGLDEVQLSWRGGVEPGEGHSYIVHGSKFVISYANFQNDAKHIHALLRVRGREFGLGD